MSYLKTLVPALAILTTLWGTGNARAQSAEDYLEKIQGLVHMIEDEVADRGVVTPGYEEDIEFRLNRIRNYSNSALTWLNWHPPFAEMLVEMIRQEAYDLRSTAFDLYYANPSDRGVALRVWFLSQDIMLKANEMLYQDLI